MENLWHQLSLQQFHFTLHIFGALVFFCAGWLYLDAYNRQCQYLAFRVAGFFLLALGSIIESTSIEAPLFASAQTVLPAYMYLLPVFGYIAILLSFPKDEMQPKPVYNALLITSGPIGVITAALRPIGSLILGVLYYIHVAEGLEWHLLSPAIAFFIFFFSDLANMIIGIAPTLQNMALTQITEPFGPLWIAEHILFLIGLLLMLRWILWYLLRRFEIQIVVFTVIGVVSVTVLTTTVLTHQLFSSLTSEISSQVTQSSRVLSYGMAQIKSETLADNRFISLDPRIVEALRTHDTQVLTTLSHEYTKNKSLRGLMFVTPTGTNIARDDQEELFSTIQPFQPIINAAVAGGNIASVMRLSGILGPSLYIVSAVPIRQGAVVSAVSLVIRPLDNSFVREIKNHTGLESTIFGGDRIAATSLPDSQSLIGTTLADQTIATEVLKNGKTYEGIPYIGMTAYIGTYQPIVDIDNAPIGMTFVGKPINEMFSLATESVKRTYLFANIILLLSVVPAIAVASYVIRQLQ